MEIRTVTVNHINIKLISQNIGGNKLGNVRQGGGIISTRIWVNNNKPHLIILTETRIAERNFEGKGIFRGYYLAQHSSSGQNSKGVIVFARTEVIKEAEYDIVRNRILHNRSILCGRKKTNYSRDVWST